MEELIDTSPRLRLVGNGVELTLDRFAAEVREGLSARRKRLSSTWLYDTEGSKLFERICSLDEYYPTRAEEEILRERAPELATLLPDGALIVELGSGSAVKTRHLLEALLRRDGEVTYAPVDVSRAALVGSAEELLADYPGLAVTGVAAEYAEGLHRIHEELAGPKVVLWLGSNVGNLRRDDAARFLGGVRSDLDREDRLLVGIDLRKDIDVLQRAYDDSEGVTAAFNRNVLTRINRELGGDFDLECFGHRAPWNADEGRIEMHLVSLRRQRVRVAALELEVEFEKGETIHTENSHKYSVAEIDDLAKGSGLALERRWTDAAGRFSLNLLRSAD